nr:hypothetical protein [Tanacetum cinerariifolium]
MPVELGSFDAIIGMDWLRRHHAMTVCDEKLISATREDDKPEGKQVKDVPIVQDFPKMFSEKLPSLPPARPIEFQIDQIPGVAPVARAPYHLAPSEMKELSKQLHELSDKVMPLEGVHINNTLQFVEEPVEIIGREIKRLKRSQVPLVKVRWNSRWGPEFTWECEDSFKKKYPHLLTNRTSSSTTKS